MKQLYAFGSVCTDNFFSLESKLAKILGRNIDLVTNTTIQNPYFKKVVEKTKTPIYE